MEPTRVALIINNSESEIGQRIAFEFDRLGYRIALTCSARSEAPIHVNTIRTTAPRNFLIVPVDFKDEEQVEKIIQAVVSKFGQLDVLINNLTFNHSPSGPLDSNFLEEFDTALQVNLYAPARLSQLAAPYLRQATLGGAIINIMPDVCHSLPSSLHLEVMKTGLGMLTKTLANSFENQNVRCIAIATGPNVADVTESNLELSGGRNHEEADHLRRIVDLIIFLTSDKARYINATVIEINSINTHKVH